MLSSLLLAPCGIEHVTRVGAVPAPRRQKAPLPRVHSKRSMPCFTQDTVTRRSRKRPLCGRPRARLSSETCCTSCTWDTLPMCATCYASGAHALLISQGHRRRLLPKARSFARSQLFGKTPSALGLRLPGLLSAWTSPEQCAPFGRRVPYS